MTLCALYEKNELPRIPLRQLVEENKWQAARHGLDGHFIEYYSTQTLNIPDAVRKLVRFVKPTAESLGTLQEVEKVEEILQRGTSAHHQRKIYEQTGSLERVVEYLMEKLTV